MLYTPVYCLNVLYTNLYLTYHHLSYTCRWYSQSFTLWSILSCWFHPISQEWSRWADKTSLLTASGMLEHAYLSMFVSSLREFQENCAYKHGELNWFIECLHRKLLAANFLFFYIEGIIRPVVSVSTVAWFIRYWVK